VSGSPVVIRARDLHKRYGHVDAVHGIDLDVHAGEVFAFLGPNGAGKTTTVEILEGYRRPTAGEVEVLGTDPATGDGGWRARIGVVLQSGQIEPLLTVRELLELYAGYYAAPRSIDDTITQVGLDDARDQRAGKLSGGQQRRLHVALALVGDPELLFLDEPTTGFDPAARRGAWDVIAGLRALGKTVFLTTHYIEEAQVLADRVAIIRAGRIVAEGTPAELAAGRARTSIRFALPAGDVHDAQSAGFELPDRLAARAHVHGGRVELTSDEPVRDLAALCTWALARGIELADLEAVRPSLEDVYLELTASDANP
jgi:ABC-2 type transport system ATP-binding protein